jgi:hypothetical protein
LEIDKALRGVFSKLQISNIPHPQRTASHNQMLSSSSKKGENNQTKGSWAAQKDKT